MSLEERFWSKVNVLGEDDCWNWKASSRGNGYGSFRFYNKIIDSHRVSWFFTYGEFPKLLVCHTCDNRSCCNPKHLFLGTYQDNVNDMISKGRKVSNTKTGLFSSSLGRKSPDAKSKYHSVYPNKKRGTWDCRIIVDKKRIYLGGFYKEEDAAKAHDDYVLENNLMGYPLNF